MIKEFEVIVALFFILVSILVLFNARKIARTKFKTVDQNVATRNIKIAFYILIVILLVFIYYIGK